MALKIINEDLILQYMKDNHLSKTAFCKLCKIGKTTFDKLINDQTGLTINPVEKVVNAMGIHFKDIFKKGEK